jgi:hypothetical protein
MEFPIGSAVSQRLFTAVSEINANQRTGLDYGKGGSQL